MKNIFLALTLLTASVVTTAQELAPVRSVSGNVVSSLQNPAASIEVVPSATYVGAVRFVLYGTADCEIHLFVDADAAKRVRRLYWVQFEAYLPEHPTLKYEPHKAYAPVSMAGVTFYQRARFGQSSDVPPANSDADRAFALLKEKGYTLPAETVNVTYKHFLDSTMRKELLLMVIEDMAPTGTTFAELTKGGVLQPNWAPIAEQLLAKAAGVFDVKFNPGAGK